MIQQLGAAGTLEKTSPEAQAAISWLVAQQHDDAWGPEIATPPYVYVTALVCQVLAALSPASPALATGLRWLEGARNKDLGWGERSGDQQSRVWCTAHVALAFLLARASSGIGNEVPGVAWLREHQNSWMDPYFVEYEFTIPGVTSRRGRANYRFDALPIVLLVLVRSGMYPLAPDLLSGVHRLLAQQVEGVWIYPSSNQKTIFNLSHAVEALTEFRRALASPTMYVAMYEQVQSIQQGQAVAAPNPEHAGRGRFLGAVLLILALVPLLWVFTGKHSAAQLWTDTQSAATSLKDNPIPVIGSLSLVVLGAGLLRLIQQKVLWALWGLLSILAFLLSVHGGVGKTLASLASPLFTALVKLLLDRFKKRQ